MRKIKHKLLKSCFMTCLRFNYSYKGLAVTSINNLHLFLHFNNHFLSHDSLIYTLSNLQHTVSRRAGGGIPPALPRTLIKRCFSIKSPYLYWRKASMSRVLRFSQELKARIGVSLPPSPVRVPFPSLIWNLQFNFGEYKNERENFNCIIYCCLCYLH